MIEQHWAFIHPYQLRLQRGIEVYIWNLSAAIARQGIQVDILTWDGSLAIPEFAQVPGVKLLKVPSVRFFQAHFGVLFYTYWLLKGNYQQVFVHFAGYGEGPALRLAQLFLRVPFSVIFHFPPSLVPHRYLEFKRWSFPKKAKYLIGVSQATANEVSLWSHRTCEVIGHGVDTQRFRPDAITRTQVRDELGITSHATLLISVAALEERKGVQWVIRAMPELMTKIPDIQYIIVGDGPYRSGLESLVKVLKLEKQVHFLGNKVNVHPYLCAADLMMVLSKGEASSISLLEALACELPGITSNHPPFDELVQDNYGIRVDEENTQQVVSAVLRLSEDLEMRKKMGAAGRAWMIQKYAWPHVAGQYQALLLNKK